MTRRLIRTALVLSLLVSTTAAFALDYRVRSGDTLNAIAARFGVTVEAIMEANDLNDHMIFVDEVLVIPTPAPTGSGPVVVTPSTSEITYTVVSGDTLGRIATRYGTTVAAIKARNGLAPGAAGDQIHVGQRLVIGGTNGALGTNRRPAMSASSNDLEVLARIVKGECPANVPWEGKVAVASVVLNRVRSSSFPNSIPGVAHQPSQFSCYNPGYPRRELYGGSVPSWCYDAAREALAGSDPTYGSTYYFNPHLVLPSWADDLDFVRRIGDDASNTHDFYRTPAETRRRQAANATGASGVLSAAVH